LSSPDTSSPRAPAILCAGIIVLDEVFQVERFPQADGKTQAEGFFAVNGGCAGNAAVAIARLGGQAALAGPLGGPAGEDLNGDRVLAALAREQIDCSGCQRLAGVPTALSAIFIDARGERMIVTYRDARLAAAAPAHPAGLVASADAVLADKRFPELVRPICTAARARGLIVVLDADRPTEYPALQAKEHLRSHALELRRMRDGTARGGAIHFIKKQPHAKYIVSDVLSGSLPISLRHRRGLRSLCQAFELHSQLAELAESDLR
jgi:sulfofructose kinase